MMILAFFSLYCYVLAKTSYFCNIIMKLGKVIEPIRYRKGENGYSILNTRVKWYDVLVTLVGNMLDALTLF
ncbi:hypothetical protein PRLR5107_25590 [Prevotella lacticifex]|uniref:Uncharacterized protein n=1 Tax=Prevotella lacticifex TaxID=2854755 RepID=A0A9R1C7V8_9BACT|nr:hypothetical protein PRLR5003_25610 [Prevotella lacticifex]GJG40096.1 hypothetical protein PRLR5019_20670 [Prevotella lacticifex]GJG43792.1 hypothetical protein PRLR5025_25780 [Prevotella lacticifex]GJG47571.1 hypothetical protein PRLR5027_31660 [Prevotella lacticifex]GJG49775.1 hypothetical protein PRLR5052_21880 [Prevotella lacticifex]